MKTKSFEKYLEGRLSKEKIAEIEEKADREACTARLLAAMDKEPQDIFKLKK